MAENLNQTITGGASERKQDKIIELRPTLFIGIGGTGMQVLMRVRRRILNTLWGGAGNRTRIEGLADFPIAQFIHFDLDNGAVIESGESQAKDLQFDQVKFTDDDKVVESFDMDKYSRDEDSLEKYPHIKEWLPLTPQRIRELRFDMSSGAGQIRAVSRLYFFDKYAKIRDKIRLKLKALKAGLSHERRWPNWVCAWKRTVSASSSSVPWRAARVPVPSWTWACWRAGWRAAKWARPTSS